MSESRFRLRIAAEELLRRRPADQPGRIARALRKAAIDLNPHQVEAAVLGLRALSERGLVLADEVGLGKTIEAGLVLAQLVAEGKERILILTPASLRRQWATELEEKLGVHASVVDGQSAAKDRRSPFDRAGELIIASHPFAARHADRVRSIPWDCVIIDEAHRLRGAHRGSKTALALREALDDRPKLLLTATPLQNGLGELYGLLSFLDPELLGPFEEFRRTFGASVEPDSISTLRTRVKPLVHRTLRRQVREYVRYTERKSQVYRFSPTAAEQRLYDEVTEYLADEETLAIHPARRALMVMVYRKLLASSPQAIGSTLGRLRDNLIERLENGEYVEDDAGDERDLLEQIEDDGGIDADETPAKRKEPPPATPARLQAEIDRLDELHQLATSIKRPAKTEALLAAIDRAFTEALSRGWPQKAVVFTESRRTQDALLEALEGAGLRDQVLLLHGGSGGADERAAIVTAFKERAKVLILTEAGAEGLNLQFANLVVNYDLPWNPQRIEQRIGRCHRYGQTRDVVVLNFLASDNAAEVRLYELLEKKLELFDGVFGATDEPLGALGDGAAFEKRVSQIFGDCRDESAIARAFDEFQAELAERIHAGMSRARSQLLDHFDDEVRCKLKLTGQAAEAALEADERALLTLVQGGIDGAELDAQGNLHLPAGGTLSTSHRGAAKGADFLTVDHPVAKGLIGELRGESASAIRYIEFQYTAGGHKISRLTPLLGAEGWWLVYRLGFDGPLSEDHLVHVVLARLPSGECMSLDEPQVASLLEVRSRDVEPRRMRAATLASTHADSALAPRVAALGKDAEVRSGEAKRRARDGVEVAFEDRLIAVEQHALRTRLAWRKARERGDDEGAERLFRDLKRIFERQGDDLKKALKVRQERLTELDKKASLEVSRTLLATAYFWLE